jgi:hypothetical protein
LSNDPQQLRLVRLDRPLPVQKVEGAAPLAVKIKTSAERDRVVAVLRPAPLTFRDLDGSTPLIAAWLVRLHAQPVLKEKVGREAEVTAQKGSE